MTWTEIQRTFDRAAQQACDLRKLLFAYVVLAVMGLLVIFCRAVAVHTGTLVGLSLGFMPFFLCGAILLAAGIILVRIYHDSIKRKKVSYRETLARSWHLMIGASYFSVPIILAYLVFWMLLGLFYLLKEIPYLGDVLSIVLVFGPLLLNVSSLILCILNVGILFFLTPIIALRGINRFQMSQLLFKRFQMDLFSHLVLLLLALLPAFITLMLLHYALHLTGIAGFMTQGTLLSQVQWLFVMIPYTACLSPSLVFFFNFATEAHVLMQDQMRKVA